MPAKSNTPTALCALASPLRQKGRNRCWVIGLALRVDENGWLLSIHHMTYHRHIINRYTMHGML
jgi:hypothetical protein